MPDISKIPRLLLGLESIDWKEDYMSIQVKELGHIVLYVRNLEVSAHFYGEVLGWKRLDAREDMAAAAFSSGRTHHELLLIEVGEEAPPAMQGYRAGLYHFGLKVGDSDDELRAVHQALKDGNVTITGMSDHTVTHSIYIMDPDGNQIELYVDVPGLDWANNPELLMTPVKPLSL